MRLEYELTIQDYIDYNIYHMYHSPTMKRSLIIQRFFAPIVFLIMPLVLNLLSDDIPLWYWYIIFSIVFIFWIIFFPKVFKKSYIKRIKKLLDEGKNSYMFGKNILTLIEDGIIVKTEAIESKYSHIEKAVVTDKHILIYISAVSAIIIPISCFDTVEDKSTFIKMLEKYR